MLEAVQERLKNLIESLENPKVSELVSRLPQGKMLRSKLILQIAPIPKSIELAAVIEIIHAASLLHDDVIDDATKRRGEVSINALFGNKSAIMLGDILYSKAFFELLTLPSPIPQIVSNAVTMLSIGELMDVELSKDFNLDKELYLDMIYKKTASLIEASAKSAAVLIGKDSKKYGEYGKRLGLAFQIVDDILDITGNEERLGKPALNDFKEGKTTLPYIYLYEKMDKEEREKLLRLYKKELNSDEIGWLKEKFFQTEALEDAKRDARKLGEEALEFLDTRDEKLKEIMQTLIERTY